MGGLNGRLKAQITLELLISVAALAMFALLLLSSLANMRTKTQTSLEILANSSCAHATAFARSEYNIHSHYGSPRLEGLVINDTAYCGSSASKVILVEWKEPA
ncbi:MAG: hypothetical protein NT157_02195 [Candidatus Micrarchaeota archaeon]|nr:hypothetical protein [Candidatus Micrarchaeota archaeon]